MFCSLPMMLTNYQSPLLTHLFAFGRIASRRSRTALPWFQYHVRAAKHFHSFESSKTHYRDMTAKDCSRHSGSCYRRSVHLCGFVSFLESSVRGVYFLRHTTLDWSTANFIWALNLSRESFRLVLNCDIAFFFRSVELTHGSNTVAFGGIYLCA